MRTGCVTSMIGRICFSLQLESYAFHTHSRESRSYAKCVCLNSNENQMKFHCNSHMNVLHSNEIFFSYACVCAYAVGLHMLRAQLLASPSVLAPNMLANKVAVALLGRCRCIAPGDCAVRLGRQGAPDRRAPRPGCQRRRWGWSPGVPGVATKHGLVVEFAGASSMRFLLL